ncbi:MAG: hypothetical protein JWR19_1076 [Pedosphaera sp.]|nr:hypothetical protein [Pedosphaera sp.]
MNLRHSQPRGFTLIELLVVIGILAIVVTMGVPAFTHMLKREGMTGSIRDVMEACSKARAMAILQGTTAEVVFHPQDGRFEVSGGSGAAAPSASPEEPDAPAVHSNAPGFSGQLSDHVNIELLDINFGEYKDAETARVRFYANGTSDEFTLILHGDNNEYRKISLEVVTALADVGPVE